MGRQLALSAPSAQTGALTNRVWKMDFKKRFIHNLVSSFAFLLAVFLIFIQSQDLLKGNWHALAAIQYWVIIAVLFLIRKPSREHSTRFDHWIIALVASWLPFFLIPESEHNPVKQWFTSTDALSFVVPLTEIYSSKLLMWLSLPIQVFGLVFTTLTLMTLGRGFGVIAALRDVKTTGIYRFIRHPLYFGEMVTGIAFLMQNPSVYNLLIFSTVMTCQVFRIFEEEAILSRDEAYVTYKNQVRYRIFPGVF